MANLYEPPGEINEKLVARWRTTFSQWARAAFWIALLIALGFLLVIALTFAYVAPQHR